MRLPRFLTFLFAALLGAVLFVACGADAVEEVATPSNDSAEGGNDTTTTSVESTGISFAASVQPVLEANCVSCHSGTGPGTTHLDMASAGDVSSIAEFLAFRVEDKQMPPWP